MKKTNYILYAFTLVLVVIFGGYIYKGESKPFRCKGEIIFESGSDHMQKMHARVSYVLNKKDIALSMSGSVDNFKLNRIFYFDIKRIINGNEFIMNNKKLEIGRNDNVPENFLDFFFAKQETYYLVVTKLNETTFHISGPSMPLLFCVKY